MGKDSEVDHVIAKVDFGDSDPWDLPSKSRIESDDQIWWFFCRQDVGKTIKRTTKSGYWKITGKEREIKARNTKICIGKKKIVVFLMGKSSAGRKTNWVIHEYHPLVQNPQRPYIICRLEKKADKKDATPGCDVGEPSASAGVDNISDIENPVAPSAISEELGHAEVNAALLSQPLLSSDWLFPEEDKLYLSELFDDEDPKNNCVMDENQPERDNSLPHQVYCFFLTLYFY
ncbi:hypothetical protein TIFTF001_056141 [Ficus carica]|uniref:NAC domain-containing protein n=2 Tax=Ficus carica TaxID=3494 RepID=A0AA88EFM5_FICCA|nr:hypothetical protein TIFTF001_056141 [Ficus carica]